MEEQPGSFHLPIEIRYQRPVWLLPLMFLGVAGAIACVLITDLSVLLKLVLVGTLLLLVHRDAGQVVHKQKGVLLDQDDVWFIVDPQGRARPARLVCATISTPGFIVLVLRDAGGKRYSFILTCSGQNKTVMRRLRVRLYYPVGQGL